MWHLFIVSSSFHFFNKTDFRQYQFNVHSSNFVAKSVYIIWSSCVKPKKTSLKVRNQEFAKVGRLVPKVTSICSKCVSIGETHVYHRRGWDIGSHEGLRAKPLVAARLL